MVDHVFPGLVPNKEEDVPRSDSFDRCDYWSKGFPDGINQEEEDLQPLKLSEETPSDLT